MNSGSVGGGREGEIPLKKGPWTAIEDAVLVELRWVNHLRPNLKKGSFSPEEEKIIIELHAKMGE
ncbi:hypothetical protein Godav_028362 [Gossypium davidsonii]|uniref:HTH myb-type domain-containing protein n=1 Tax=Gossypium davidsonii TaxID=34287 RepID=A0A7J8RZ89_GOSDV|nr:hypothetical protein [Gossypium davidsonii]